MSIERLTAYHAALNAFDLDAVEAMFAEDAEYISPGLNGVVSGREMIMKSMRDYFADHADQQAMDEKVVSLSPNVVQSIWSLQATSSSTGKAVNRRGCEVVTFNSAGKISRVEVCDSR